MKPTVDRQSLERVDRLKRSQPTQSQQRRDAEDPAAEEVAEEAEEHRRREPEEEEEEAEDEDEEENSSKLKLMLDVNRESLLSQALEGRSQSNTSSINFNYSFNTIN